MQNQRVCVFEEVHYLPGLNLCQIFAISGSETSNDLVQIFIFVFVFFICHTNKSSAWRDYLCIK
jgi:hypothetical protein